MQDVLSSFLLFLAASALIIVYLLPAYAVVCGLRHCWLYYKNEYFYTHTEEQIEATFGNYQGKRFAFLWWLISRFLAPWACVFFAVLAGYYVAFEQYAKTATDIVASRIHNLASFLAALVFFLILGLYIRRVEKSNEYPEFSDYLQGRKLLCGIAAVFALLFALYVGGLSQWLRGENVHKRAKLYFVAGENLNGFRRMFPSHPDGWKMRPLNTLQRVIFNRAARLVPDDDGELAAWENRWFWSHYGRKVSMAFSAHSETYVGRNPGSQALLDKWWRCLEDLGSKPIRDPKVRRDLYMLEYHRLAWNAYENIYLLVPGNHSRSNSDASYRIHRMTFEEYGARLAPGLVRLMEEWQRTPENRVLIATHPHTEALGLLTLTLALQLVMESEIRAGTFRCENDSARQYLAARRLFFEPDRGKAAYLRVDDLQLPKNSGINVVDTENLYAFATKWQLLAQHVLEQRCGLEVPGRISPDIAPDYCQRHHKDGERWTTEKLTPSQCLEERARKYLDEELQLMLDKLPRRAPDEAAEQPEAAPADAVAEE